MPLRGDVIDQLQNWLSRKSQLDSDEPLFGIFGKRSAEMLRADYARCEPPNPYVDKCGRVADWHALRTTFASLLILAGNPLVTVQKLMRHSTPELTANLYAQLGLEDFSEAVETLPKI